MARTHRACRPASSRSCPPCSAASLTAPLRHPCFSTRPRMSAATTPRLQKGDRHRDLMLPIRISVFYNHTNCKYCKYYLCKYCKYYLFRYNIRTLVILPVHHSKYSSSKLLHRCSDRQADRQVSIRTLDGLHVCVCVCVCVCVYKNNILTACT